MNSLARSNASFAPYDETKRKRRMAEDREVLREIWEGRIPVSFSLDDEEVHTLNVPEPFYVMVPRLLYFPLVTDKVSPKNSGFESFTFHAVQQITLFLFNA